MSTESQLYELVKSAYTEGRDDADGEGGSLEWEGSASEVSLSKIMKATPSKYVTISHINIQQPEGDKRMDKTSSRMFTNYDVTIPLAIVQHVTRRYETDKTLTGAFVITSHTKYNVELDDWENAIWLGATELEEFIEAWYLYRHELEEDKDG